MKKATAVSTAVASALLIGTGYFISSGASATSANAHVLAAHHGQVAGHNHDAGHAHGANGAAAATDAIGMAETDTTMTATTGASTPDALLSLLGERIVAKDIDGIIALHEKEAAIVDYDGSIIRGHKAIRAFYLEWFKSDPVLTVAPGQTVIAGGKRNGAGKVRDRTASVMGTYSLEQTAADGTRETFTGNFCDIVRQQPNGSWLYVNDNPYPPHG